MTLQALRGTTDIYGEAIADWTHIEQSVRASARLYGYDEIRTPILEDSALFLRSIGETSDIVQKEMFRFEDRGGHDMVLRPEGTAAVVRALLQHKMHKQQALNRLFYMGPMFRAERPQAGRYRQFHQCGVEALGSEHPAVDAEVITLCYQLLKNCGVQDLRINITSMGTRQDQQASAEALKARLQPHIDQLCAECQARLAKNVFRSLDCKKEQCRTLAWEGGWPFLLSTESQEHYDAVRRALDAAQIEYNDQEAFARGLDYYTRTVFEVQASGLGAQNVVAAGGRYDHLVEDLGGPAVSAVGFAAGMERILIAAGEHLTTEPQQRHGVFLAVTHAELLEQGIRYVQQLREQGVHAMMDFNVRSLKAQFREADRLRMQYVVVFGERELSEKRIALKDLDQGTQEQIHLNEWVAHITQLAKN